MRRAQSFKLKATSQNRWLALLWLLAFRFQLSTSTRRAQSFKLKATSQNRWLALSGFWLSAFNFY
jgi:hypothetical protein